MIKNGDLTQGFDQKLLDSFEMNMTENKNTGK
jgi:hypothetical protein